MKQHIVYSGIILFLAVLLFKAECSKAPQKGEDIKVNGKKYELIDRKIDTVLVPVKPDVVYRDGKTIYKDTTIYQKVPILGTSALVDELMKNYYDSILMEHFAKKVFTDTIRFGQYGNVYIKDTIQENAILARIANSDLIFPNVKETLTVKEKPKNQLYLGAKSIIVNNTIGGIGSGVIFKTKRDRLYGVGAIIDRQKNVNFTLDLYIKL